MLIHIFFILMRKIMHCIHMNPIMSMSILNILIVSKFLYNHNCMLFVMLFSFILRVCPN